ncbi:uncharacterized protein LOC128984125 [Macrosteles quadrilineatus]|uniref:uncharacterized protein LOC128984125 n=1 Tax=Macrosteles quadrilineatus TaxID=74068 RepID=UPI0023E1B67E|nr:uncharacterized protein LOC128984125 [Macrosteles quadrilineatus]
MVLPVGLLFVSADDGWGVRRRRRLYRQRDATVLIIDREGRRSGTLSHNLSESGCVGNTEVHSSQLIRCGHVDPLSKLRLENVFLLIIFSFLGSCAGFLLQHLRDKDAVMATLRERTLFLVS